MTRPTLPTPGAADVWGSTLNSGIDAVADAVDTEASDRDDAISTALTTAEAYTDSAASDTADAAAAALDQALASLTDVYVDTAATGTITLSATTVIDSSTDPPTVTQGYAGCRLTLAGDVVLRVNNLPAGQIAKFSIQTKQANTGGPYKLSLDTPFVAPAANDPVTGVAWNLSNLGASTASAVECLESRGFGGTSLRLSNIRDQYGVASPGTVPNTPSAPVATAGDGTLTLTWTVPSDGGSPITNVHAVLSGGSSQDITVSAGGSAPVSCTFTGQTNAVAQTGTVRFDNANGQGIASSPSNSATPTAGTPPTALKEPIKGLIMRSNGPPTTGNGASEVLTYSDVNTYVFTIEARRLSSARGVFDMTPIVSEIARAKLLGARFSLRVFTGGSSPSGYAPNGTPPTDRKWSATGTNNTGDPIWAKALGADTGVAAFTLWDQTKRESEADPGSATAGNNQIAYTEYVLSRYWTKDYQTNFFTPLVQAIAAVCDNQDVVADIDICLGATVFNEACLKHTSGLENHSGTAATGAPITGTINNVPNTPFTVYAQWPSGDDCNAHNTREFLRNLKASSTHTGEPDWTFGNDNDAMWKADFAGTGTQLGAFKACFAILKAAFTYTRIIFSFNPYNIIQAGTYNWATNTGTPTVQSGNTLSNTRTQAIMDWFVGATGGTTDSGLGLQAILFQKSFTGVGSGFVYNSLEAYGNPCGVQSKVGSDTAAQFAGAFQSPHNFFRYEVNGLSSYTDSTLNARAPNGGYNAIGKANPTSENTRPGYGTPTVVNQLVLNAAQFNTNVTTGMATPSGATAAQEAVITPTGLRGFMDKLTGDGTNTAIGHGTKGGTAGIPVGATAGSVAAIGATVSAERSFYIAASGATTRNVRVSLQWYDSTGARLAAGANDIAGSTVSEVPGSLVRATVSGAVPTSAAYVRVLSTTTAGAGAEIHYLAMGGFYVAATPAAYIPPAGG